MLSPWPLWFSFFFAGLFGAIIGSFANVCIVRLPRDESIVAPRSRCPHCRRQLRWWENIPLLSFLLLGGRCRSCRRPIAWRYPLIELLTALLSLAAWWKFGDPLRYGVYFMFFLVPLVIVSFIDLEHLIIPDVISIPGIVVGLGTRLLVASAGHRGSAFIDGVIGAAVGGGFLFIVAWVYEKLKKREGLGGGDVKLAAMLGSFFGWQAAIFLLMISSVLGAVVGLICILVFKRKITYALPFGPFLALAGILHLFAGDAIISWYLMHLRF